MVWVTEITQRLLSVIARGDLWTALILAVGLGMLRRVVGGQTELARPIRRVLTVGMMLALIYAGVVVVETLFMLSLTGIRQAGERGGLILLLAYLAWEALDIGLNRLRERLPAPDMRTERRLNTAAAIVRWLGRAFILFIVVATILDLFRINIAPLVASVGVVGLALGLGAQKLVQDVISGLFILLEDQFHVGDGVAIGGIAGTVEEMTLRVTKVRDFQGVLHIIPNSEIRILSNRTRDWARAIAEVSVAYDSDLGRVEAVLTQVGEELFAENPDDIFLETPIPLGPEVLGDSGITYRLIARVQPGQQWTAQRLMRRRIKEAFDRAGIVIPFPQLDVHFPSPPPVFESAR